MVSRLVTGDNGKLGLFGMDRSFGDKIDGFGSELNLVAVFNDSKYANAGFGITAEQSLASCLAETRLSSGLRSIGLDYNYRHNINDNWQIFGEALYEHFSSDVRNSPISRSNSEAEIGIGLIYISYPDKSLVNRPALAGSASSKSHDLITLPVLCCQLYSSGISRYGA